MVRLVNNRPIDHPNEATDRIVSQSCIPLEPIMSVNGRTTDGGTAPYMILMEASFKPIQKESISK